MFTNRIAKLIVTSCAFALVGLAQAGLVTDPVDLSVPVTLGAAYDNVGMFWVHSADGWGKATGTLVAPNAALTAAHIFDHSGIDEVRFYLGPDLYNAPYVRVNADLWVNHPDYLAGAWTTPDMSVVHLTTDVTGIAPAELYTGTQEVGSPIVLAGFGMWGNNTTGELAVDGIRRAGTNVVSSYGLGKIRTVFDAPGSPGETLYEYSGAHGDSGGPGFIDIGGIDYIAGVIKGGDRELIPGDCYGVETIMTRVSPNVSWIDDTIAGFVPEPSSLMLLGLSMFLVTRRRVH